MAASSKNTQDLKSELATLLGFTAQNILRLAVVVNELENRGEELKAIRMGLLPILRKIAAGEIIPDVVVLYAGQPGLLKTVARMTLDKQQDLVTNKITFAELRTQKTPAPKKQRRIDYDENENKPGLAAIAAKATPRDIAAMAADLIAKCSDPKIAMNAFMEIARRRKLLSA